MNLSKQLKYSSLSSKKEIQNIFVNGRKVKSKIGPIYFYNDLEKKETEFAILIKKNIGKAHYRNYIKRIIRFYIRSHSALFEDFNRVVFLYNHSKKTIDYTSLCFHYDLALKLQN